MGRIDQDYGNNSPVLSTDKVIGTNTAGETKNFTADGLKVYMENNLTGATGSVKSLDGDDVSIANGLVTGIVAGNTPVDATVTGSDLLRGVDSVDSLNKNYTVDSLKAYVQSNIDDSISTVYDDLVADSTSLTGTTAVMSYGVNVFKTATSNDYACKLPQPVTGKKTTIINLSDRSISLFPSNTGGKINNLPVSTPLVIPNDGKAYVFICIENPLPGDWSIFTAPANSQKEFAEIQISHTNGVATSVTGTTTANMGSSSAGVDGSGNLSLTGSWLTEPVKTTFTKIKSYTNILQSDIASDFSSDSIYVNLNTAFKTGASSSTIGARLTSNYSGGVSFLGGFAPVGTLNSPVETGDTNTMYDELVMDNPNGVSDQLGLGGDFSRYYYNFGFYIPASAATKTYKFKIFLETLSL